MVRRHTGAPPPGWENVPGLAGFVRQIQAPPPKDGEPGPPGRDGRDGSDGKPGDPGKDGEPGPPGKDGRPGRDGRDGKDGKPGLPGKDGRPGHDGRDGKDGRDGLDGAPGVGIKKITAHGGDMQIELTDGSTSKHRLATGGGTPFGGSAPSSGGAGGVTDHGALEGLADDDHPQYLNATRGDARYPQLAHGHAIADVSGLQSALDSKEPGFVKTLGYAAWNGSAWVFLNEAYALAGHNHSGVYQPLDADLTAIAALAGTTGLLRKTAANTWSLDTAVYLTAEADPVFSASPAAGISSGAITNWNAAYGWGNHAAAGYQAALFSGTNIKTINGSSILGAGDLVISGSGGFSPTIDELTGTQSFTATALANVTQLVEAVVANGVYRVDCFVTFQSAATTTGLNLGFTSPAGSVCQLEVVVPITSTAAASQLRTIFPNAAATNTGNVLGTGVTAINSNHTARISGVIHVGSTAGNFQIRAATEVAGSAVTLQIGSSLVMERIA